MDLAGKRVLVIGAGKSGFAAARFLLGKGAAVTLTDNRKADRLGLPADAPAGLNYYFGRYPTIAGGWDLVVTSPGVPPEIPPLCEARQAGIPVTGEFELAMRYARGPVIAITGTNGKTTTTTLTGCMFRDAGYPTLVAGNIGLPLTSEVENRQAGGIIVVEASSFQLETAATFKPKVAVVLNITPDHLDRHKTMEQYTKAKATIFARQTDDDWTVLNRDDPGAASLAASTGGRVIFFSRKHNLDRGVFVRDGMIIIRKNAAAQAILPVRDLRLPGKHNLENALAAVAAAWVMGVPAASMARTLTGFPGVPHRLEPVAEINGVRYVNDSKGTNPEAAERALQAYAGPIILIAGGRNKGNRFDRFADRIKERVRKLIVLGESAGEITAAVKRVGFTDIMPADDLEQAVHLAHRAALPGEIVLLSPACASWDMFKSFEERGDLFRRIVLSLARGPANAG